MKPKKNYKPFLFIFSVLGITSGLVILTKSVISKPEQESSTLSYNSSNILLNQNSQSSKICDNTTNTDKIAGIWDKSTPVNLELNLNCAKLQTSTQENEAILTSNQLPVKLIDVPLSNGTNANLPEVTPWPQINDHARLAKVPVIMYHDILPKKEVFFDVTPEELEEHFKLIQDQGLTPISLDLLVAHLRTGVPLPEKPILLTFDDGYGGHYKYVYPLLKKYGYPAIFSIYIKKMERKTGRSSVTWEQLKEMAADPRITIVSHSVNHPRDLRELSDDQLAEEVMQSKRILEQKLGIPIRYFTYPEGKADARVKQWVIAAGYRAALSMNDLDEHFAGESPDLLTIGRFGQSRLKEVIQQAWGGHPLPRYDGGFNFNTVIHKEEFKVDDVSIVLITGGRPTTIHADTRHQVPEIIADTGAEAAVDGGFFSLESLDSNVMIGPVLSHNNGEFIPGSAWENPRLKGRPLVLISSKWVKFIPYDPDKHNTLLGMVSESTDGEIITDAFVGAAWLVKDGEPQAAETFGTLYGFELERHRAFWGINQAGQPVIGVSKTPIDSVSLGKILAQLGLRDAIMVDSGASTSLAYKGESMVEYTPRPVPHVVALFPPLPSLPQMNYVGLSCVLDHDVCASDR